MKLKETVLQECIVGRTPRRCNVVARVTHQIYQFIASLLPGVDPLNNSKSIHFFSWTDKQKVQTKMKDGTWKRQMNPGGGPCPLLAWVSPTGRYQREEI